MEPSLAQFGRYISSVRSTATAARYQVSAERFLEWLKERGIESLESAPRNTLAEYSASLVAGGYMTGTIYTHLAGVRRYIRWARMQDGMVVPDFHPPELPKHKRQIRDVLDAEQLTLYFARARAELKEPARTAALLLPCTGLRGGEMIALPLNAFKRSKIRLQDRSEKTVLMCEVRGKGGHERRVPLLDEGRDILVEYLEGWREEWRLKHPKDRWLFPGKSGYMSDRTLRVAVQNVRQPLGVRFSPHTMRRTYLTTLYRKGVDVAVLAKIAGHADVKTLLTHYLALDDHDVAKAVHQVGANLA